MVTSSISDDAVGPPRAPPPRSYHLLMRAIDRPHAVARVVVLSFMLALPAVAGGLVMDDCMIEDAVRRDPWSAFEFRPRDPIARAKFSLPKSNERGVDFPAPLEQVPLVWMARRDEGAEPWPLPRIGGRATFAALQPFP